MENTLNKQTQKTLFSSNKDDWSTPDYLFEYLDKRFGPFILDPAATCENSKCSRFYTPNDDGLSKSWKGERVFINPPYGRNVTGKWVKKAYEECQNGNTEVTMLLPSRTDTLWMHQYCMKADTILFIKGRVKFIGANHGDPFPSMIVHFRDPIMTNAILNVESLNVESLVI